MTKRHKPRAANDNGFNKDGIRAVGEQTAAVSRRAVRTLTLTIGGGRQALHRAAKRRYDAPDFDIAAFDKRIRTMEEP